MLATMLLFPVAPLSRPCTALRGVVLPLHQQLRLHLRRVRCHPMQLTSLPFHTTDTTTTPIMRRTTLHIPKNMLYTLNILHTLPVPRTLKNLPARLLYPHPCSSRPSSTTQAADPASRTSGRSWNHGLPLLLHWTIHYVESSRTRRSCRCCARCCRRKLQWYVVIPSQPRSCQQLGMQILWYNKSRATARICPACQRLYRLGDVLPDHLAKEDEQGAPSTSPSPFLAKEQELSGLCEYLSLVCAFPHSSRLIRFIVTSLLSSVLVYSPRMYA